MSDQQRDTRMTSVPRKPTEQPAEVGTFVRDKNGDLWVRVPAPPEVVWPWVNVKLRTTAGWDNIQNPVIVHEGYAPPTPEPIHHGARVIDDDGLRCVRKSGLDSNSVVGPWATTTGMAVFWAELAQPVKVINDGTDW